MRRLEIPKVWKKWILTVTPVLCSLEARVLFSGFGLSHFGGEKNLAFVVFLYVVVFFFHY